MCMEQILLGDFIRLIKLEDRIIPLFRDVWLLFLNSLPNTLPNISTFPNYIANYNNSLFYDLGSREYITLFLFQSNYNNNNYNYKLWQD